MSNAARNRLSAAQTALVRALLAGGPVPTGFDPERIRIEASALLVKRRRVVEWLRPDIVDVLGDARFVQLFEEWAVTRPRLDGVSARVDADAFATWLAAHGHVRRLPWWRRWLRH